MRRRRTPLRILAAAVLVAALARPAAAQDQAAGATETVEQALCRLIDGAARAQRLPPAYLTRLLWQESSFRAGAVSPAGAQGVAQFMPGTARERGLADPFDPEQAVPEAAEYLSELRRRFGNLGLAAAGYNAGPGRVGAWLEGRGSLPGETLAYVSRITGRTAEDWAAAARGQKPEQEAEPEDDPRTCLQVTAVLRVPRQAGVEAIAQAPVAPWGVQLAGNFSKERALAAFARARGAYASLLAEARPMVIGTRLRSRGTRAFYRVRVPAATRQEAEGLCGRIRSLGGGCVVLPS